MLKTRRRASGCLIDSKTLQREYAAKAMGSQASFERLVRVSDAELIDVTTKEITSMPSSSSCVAANSGGDDEPALRTQTQRRNGFAF